MISRRERRILAATAALAVGVPAGAAWWVRARTDAVAERLSRAAGMPARIGGVDASLTGAIRLSDVALGDLVAADAIEASVAMASLLDGRLRADELRVEAPRVAITVDAGGDSDLARLARRLAGARPGRTGTAPGGVRRIVVAEGTLTARIAGVGELSAAGVELVPDAAGVRIVTGPVELRGRARALELDLRFARSAADLSLATMRFGRVLAVGGTGTLAAGSGAVALRDVAAGRLTPGGPLELRASVDDAGIARPLAVEVSTGGGPGPTAAAGPTTGSGPTTAAGPTTGSGPAAAGPTTGSGPTAATGPSLTVTLRGDRVPLRALASLAPHGLDLTTARVTGTLAIRRAGPHPASSLELSGDARVEHLVIAHPTFAADPVPITAVVRGDVTISPDAIAMTRGALELGAARIAATGWLRRGAPLAGQLELQLAAAPCADLYAALPAELRGPLDGLALTGSLGARARLAIDLAAPAGEGVTLTRSFSGGCRVAAEPPLADVTALAEPGDQQLADGSHARVGRGEPGHVELRGLPAHVPGAFVSAEDARFHDHDGFDLVQIARSLEIDLREHRLARGGSTISQQLVKNAFLSQRRSVDRKLWEAILTWRLEARLDKHHILERYLDIVELGPRVFGLGPAARYWFDTPARELTIRQAAFLAALTSQPASMSRRVRRAGGLDPDSAERVAVILRAMRRDGVITRGEYDDARTSPLGFAPSALGE